MTAVPEEIRGELMQLKAALNLTLQRIDQLVGESSGAGLTINEALEAFAVEHKEIGRRSQSWRAHAKDLVRRWGGMSLADVMKTSNVSQYVALLRDAGNSPSTIQSKLGLLRNLCRLSTEAGHPIVFPKRLAAAVKVHNERTRVLSRTERRMLQLAMSTDDWDIVTIALKTGMRSQEIFGLRVDDCDFAKGTIFIRNTKTDVPRLIPMVGEVRSIVGRAAKSRREYVVQPKGFGTYKSRHNLAGNWKDKRFRPALERAGIEDFRFHDLRHCATTAMIEAGADPVSVAKIMGWKSQQFLMRYTNLGMSTLAKAASKA